MALDCINIGLERIRAYIAIGPYYFVTTGTDDNADGDILSFGINKSREQPVATFRCQLNAKLDSGLLDSIDYVEDNLGLKIIVHGGVGAASDTNLPRLFQGYVTDVTQEPNEQDARYVLLSISGEDEFAKMRYGPKFSRRFKTGDDPYAVITGGKHRDGGNLTELKRIPAGKRGVEFASAGSTPTGGNENSPLIRTPDLQQGRSPSGASPKSKEANSADSGPGNYRFEPEHFYASTGDRILVKVIDIDSGDEVDPMEFKNVVKCLCHCSPSPQLFTGSSTGGTGLEPDKNTYPVKISYYGKGKPYDTDPDFVGFEFTITGDYPTKITFVHPLDAGTCVMHLHQVPPHDHRDMPRGGPAVGSYDVFQV